MRGNRDDRTQRMTYTLCVVIFGEMSQQCPFRGDSFLAAGPLCQEGMTLKQNRP